MELHVCGRFKARIGQQRQLLDVVDRLHVQIHPENHFLIAPAAAWPGDFFRV
jgi:hypothetical protein